MRKPAVGSIVRIQIGHQLLDCSEGLKPPATRLLHRLDRLGVRLEHLDGSALSRATRPSISSTASDTVMPIRASTAAASARVRSSMRVRTMAVWDMQAIHPVI